MTPTIPEGQNRNDPPSDLDGRGVPLAVRVTGANRNDSQEALALVDAIPLLQSARRRSPGQGLGIGQRYGVYEADLVRAVVSLV
jgi:hypothetical protein